MTMPLEERQAHRLQYLRAVYDASDGVAGRFLRFNDIGEELGFDEKHAEDVADYLAAEGLIKWTAMGIIELTHWGLKEVEQSLSDPEKPTEHFPAFVVAQNYMHVETMTGSQVQQGTVGSTQISAAARVELEALVADLRQAFAELELPDEQHDEFEADLATVETQLASPHPKPGVIHECLTSIRTIFEGALGSGLATTAPHLPELAERIAHAISTLV